MAPAFAAWQLGSILHIGALLLVGRAEGGSPQILWSGATIVTFAYSLRLAGGLLMAMASWRWLRAALGHPAEAEQEVHHEALDANLLPTGRSL